MTTQPRIVDLTISLLGLDTEALLRDWRWLVPQEFAPVQMSKFGHWFFTDPVGRVHNLDLIEGDLQEIAPSIADYNRLKDLAENRTEWFLDGFVFRCDAEGLKLGPGECYGWRVHPMIGGKFEFENIQVFSLSVYESLMGQLLPQWKNLPPGQPIPQIKII
jgi:hypothetical protein